MTAANAQRLITTPEVDGLLVGTSSLTAAEFVPIVEIVGREAALDHGLGKAPAAA